MPTIRKIHLCWAIAAALFVDSLPAEAKAVYDDVERYALLVGVTKYSHSGMNQPVPLRYPEADAKAIGKFLEGHGYKVDYLLGPKATKKEIESKLRGLAKKSNSDGVCLVGFWGHGIEFDKSNESMFCPYDTRLRFAEDSKGNKLFGKNGERLVEPNPSTLVGMSEVFRSIQLCPAGNKLLIADCCRRSPNAARARKGAVKRAFGSNVRVSDLPDNMAAIFACKVGEVAFEHEDWGHGAFSKALLDLLPGQVAERETEITSILAPLRKRVNQLVLEKTNGQDKQTVFPLFNGVPDLKLRKQWSKWSSFDRPSSLPKHQQSQIAVKIDVKGLLSSPQLKPFRSLAKDFAKFSLFEIQVSLTEEMMRDGSNVNYFIRVVFVNGKVAKEFNDEVFVNDVFKREKIGNTHFNVNSSKGYPDFCMALHDNEMVIFSRKYADSQVSSFATERLRAVMNSLPEEPIQIGIDIQSAKQTVDKLLDAFKKSYPNEADIATVLDSIAKSNEAKMAMGPSDHLLQFSVAYDSKDSANELLEGLTRLHALFFGFGNGRPDAAENFPAISKFLEHTAKVSKPFAKGSIVQIIVTKPNDFAGLARRMALEIEKANSQKK